MELIHKEVTQLYQEFSRGHVVFPHGIADPICGLCLLAAGIG